jgi:carboxypeptidase PM20D1
VKVNQVWDGGTRQLGFPAKHSAVSPYVLSIHLLMRKILIAAGITVLLLFGVAAVRTWRFRAATAPVATATGHFRPGAAERLGAAIRFRTVSGEDGRRFDPGPFRAFSQFLVAAFPATHRSLKRESIGESLLYTWAGADSSLDAILFIAHTDVVPVEAGTEDRWSRPPFSGMVEQGFIWGRGAIDNKSAVMGILEAVESLLLEEFRPKRTLYLAFGHDEEVGGGSGAARIASELRRRGARFEVVLDEGGVLGDGILPGVSRRTALVGVAEKGFATVELSASTDGGHSSLPPKHTAIGMLSAAVARLEENRPAVRWGVATEGMFRAVAPHFPLGQRAVFANLWLAGPLVRRKLSEDPATDAMVRTTTAPTIFQAGTKDNVLPTTAKAAVNFRIIQGDSVAGMIEHVRRAVDDSRVQVKLGGRFSAEPSRVSSDTATSYRVIADAIRSVDTSAIVAPFLVVVVTDSRYFADLGRNVYRFLPLRMEPRDLQRIHGVDERVAIADYERAIRIWRELIVRGTAMGPGLSGIR